MEWTLAHKHVDGRGNRRSFTIASSPTESDIHLGVKFHNPSSSFKKALFAMQPGDDIMVGQLSGNFTLPTDDRKKLVFIAGGVGITPFRSMLQYVIDTNQQRVITLFYVVNNAEEIAYKAVLRQAEACGVTVVLLIGIRLNAKLLKKYVPDFEERHFYISGSNGLVESYRELLRHNGVAAGRITSDYFSGY